MQTLKDHTVAQYRNGRSAHQGLHHDQIRHAETATLVPQDLLVGVPKNVLGACRQLEAEALLTRLDFLLCEDALEC